MDALSFSKFSPHFSENAIVLLPTKTASESPFVNHWLTIEDRNDSMINLSEFIDGQRTDEEQWIKADFGQFRKALKCHCEEKFGKRLPF